MISSPYLDPDFLFDIHYPGFQTFARPTYIDKKNREFQRIKNRIGSPSNQRFLSPPYSCIPAARSSKLDRYFSQHVLEQVDVVIGKYGSDRNFRPLGIGTQRKYSGKLGFVLEENKYIVL